MNFTWALWAFFFTGWGSCDKKDSTSKKNSRLWIHLIRTSLNKKMKLKLDFCAESELVHRTVETFCWVTAIPLWTLQIVFPFYKGFGKPTFLSHYYGLCMVVLTLLSKSHYLPPFLYWSHMSLWTDKKICSPVCRWGHEEIKPQSLLITPNLSSENNVLVICWVGLFIQTLLDFQSSKATNENSKIRAKEHGAKGAGPSAQTGHRPAAVWGGSHLQKVGGTNLIHEIQHRSQPTNLLRANS